jgi:RNA recognition motif-containing protein
VGVREFLPDNRTQFPFFLTGAFRMNIYVGNLSFEATEADLENEFSQYGDVKTVNLIKDRDTGQSRGFAFVEMFDDQSGRDAIAGLNLKQIAGRSVTVNEARPREERRGGGRRW